MRQAAKILNKLLLEGELNSSDGALLADYHTPEIRAELDVWSEEFGFTLIDMRGKVYLIPNTDSELLSFTIRDVRESESKSDRMIDAFLQCYITMTILWMFYGGKNNNPKRVVFLQVRDILATLDERLSDASTSNADTASAAAAAPYAAAATGSAAYAVNAGESTDVAQNVTTGAPEGAATYAATNTVTAAATTSGAATYAVTGAAAGAVTGAAVGVTPVANILETEYEINFSQIASHWNALPVDAEQKRKTRLGSVLRTCRFLERQRLLFILDDKREIRPTERLDDLMVGYYLDMRRIEEINELFNIPIHNPAGNRA